MQGLLCILACLLATVYSQTEFIGRGQQIPGISVRTGGSSRFRRQSVPNSYCDYRLETKLFEWQCTRDISIPGVMIETIRAGDGVTFPRKGQTVVVHYAGTFPNGTKFDSSIDRGTPFKTKIGVGQVIPGWDEGFMKLSVGQIAKLTISSGKAYGKQGHGASIPPDATLVFYVELIRIESDVDTSIPGVKIENISAGDGVTFPRKGQTVVVHYVGQFPNGKQFDSSVDRGTPFKTKIGVGRVIQGWDEGFMKLSVGQKAKLTISPEKAYGQRGSGASVPPNATLVFAVHLIRIEP